MTLTIQGYIYLDVYVHMEHYKGPGMKSWKENFIFCCCILSKHSFKSVKIETQFDVKSLLAITKKHLLRMTQFLELEKNI